MDDGSLSPLPRLVLVLITIWLPLLPGPLTGLRAAARSDQLKNEYRAGELIVKLEPGVGVSPASVLTSYGLSVKRHIPGLNLYLVRVPPGQEEAFRRRLAKEPAVRYAELNYLARTSSLPEAVRPMVDWRWPRFGFAPSETRATVNDTAYPQQWNLQRIRAPNAWDLTTGSAVTIAILGTGVDLDHPDLSDKIVPGYDVVNGDHDPIDDNGYYTFVAGIAAAVTNNGEGIAGVSWGGRLMPVKVMGADGRGSYADIIEGVRWATDHGANIINMSFVGFHYSQALQDAMDYAQTQGVQLLVASTGDYAGEGNPRVYPAALRNVLAVGGTDKTNARLRASGYGDYVDLAAPAETIVSTWWQSGQHVYGVASGADFAAPHVAGVAALILSVNPSLSLDQLTSLLRSSAVDLGDPGFDDYYGYGLVDTNQAVWTTPHFLQVSPDRLFYTYDGQQLSPAVQRLTNHTTSALTWSATANAGWIHVVAPRGYTPSYAEVSVERGEVLGCGIRVGQINVTSLMPSSLNSPQTVDVILRFSLSCRRTYLPLVVRGQ